MCRLQRAASKPLENHTWLLEVGNGRCGISRVLMGGGPALGDSCFAKITIVAPLYGRLSSPPKQFCLRTTPQSWDPGQKRVWMDDTKPPGPLYTLQLLYSERMPFPMSRMIGITRHSQRFVCHFVTLSLALTTFPP